MPKLTGHESCVLLQSLNLRQNNLQEVCGVCVVVCVCVCEGRGVCEGGDAYTKVSLFFQFPRLHNHVLLRELNLAENGLDNIGPITSSWLPLLQKLNLSCNW